MRSEPAPMSLTDELRERAKALRGTARYQREMAEMSRAAMESAQRQASAANALATEYDALVSLFRESQGPADAPDGGDRHAAHSTLVLDGQVFPLES